LNCENIEVWRASTIGEFFDRLLRKEQVLRATGADHRYHFQLNSVFERHPSVAVFLEEGEGITSVVILPIRAVFEDEDRMIDWEHRRWFFPIWRRMIHDGSLAKALDQFFNRWGADFQELPILLAGYRRELLRVTGGLMSEAEGLHLSTGEWELEKTQARIRSITEGASHQATKMLWCKLFHVIQGYIEYEHAKNADHGD
jgi:hypothetical protein